MSFISYSRKIIKVRPMRFSKLFILFLILSGCKNLPENLLHTTAQKQIPTLTVQAESVVLHPEKGQVFHLGAPFTGTAVRYFSNGKKAVSIEYSNGKKDGKHIKWFENGIKSFEANYVSNKQHGTTSTWWQNGNPRSISKYEKGIPHGVQQQWYISGAKFKKINLVNGKEEGLQQSWRENGKLYNNYEAKNGRIFGLKRAKLCYELDDEMVQIENK